MLGLLALVLGLGLATSGGGEPPDPAAHPYDIAPPAPGNAPPQGAATDPDPAPPPGGPPWYGEVNIVVLLIQFPDYPADGSHDAAYYEELLFAHEAGSMWDYYNENSYGVFSLNGTVVPVWLNATYNMTYYGNHEFSNSEAEGNAQTLVREAVQKADAYLDFGPYDEDGDGTVDHLAIVHSGPVDEANGGGGPDNDPAIWSHRWGITPERVDGVNVSGYFMQGESTPMGVFAHEYGHNLGLPDLYDTDYSSSGIGRWGLMGSGSWGNGGRTPSHLTAWSKSVLGWLDPVIPSGSGSNLTVARAEDSPVAYKLPMGGRDSSEYFLFENRQKVLYDRYLPGAGLLIWHIDEEASQPNDAHRLVDLEEADNNDNPNQGSEPWANTSAGFSDDSAPNAHDYEDNPTGFAIYNISVSGDNMTVQVKLPRNLGVVGLGPALGQINTPVNLVLAVQNKGFITEFNVTAHLRVADGQGAEVFNASEAISQLEAGQTSRLVWEWAPQTRESYTLNGWIDWSDSIPSDDSRQAELNVTTVFYQETFEGSPQGWTTINDGATALLWHLTDRESLSSNQSYWAGREASGQYLDNMDQSLVTPQFNLTGMQVVTLAFYHRYHIELAYDGGVVDISTDNGSTWTRLTPQEGYDTGVAAFGGQQAYSGGSQGWRLASFNLTAYIDQTVKLRYRFASDAGVVDSGWFIDEVVLHGTYARDVVLAANATALTATPGQTLPLELRITNSGGQAADFNLSADLPAGWLLDLPASLSLDPSQTVVVDLNLILPAQVRAGSYTLNLTATHAADPNVTAALPLAVEVLPLYTLQLELVSVLGSGTPGQAVAFSFNLTNLGNADQGVSLAVAGLEGWAAPTQVNLTPYQTLTNLTVTVRVPVWANASQAFTATLRGASPNASATAELTLVAQQVYGAAVALNPASTEVLPYQNLTLTLELTNTGNGPTWVNASLALPANWTGDRMDFSAWLARDANLSWQVNLTPGWELVNTTVAVIAQALSGPATATANLNLTYSQLYDLRVEPLMEAVTLWPGQNRTFAFNLTNGGNGPETVSLQAWLTGGGPGWQGGLTPAALTLPPGGLTAVAGWYSAPAGALYNATATYNLALFSGGNALQGDTTDLSIHQIYGLTLAGATTGLTTGQDDNLTWALEVTNTGNGPAWVNLTATGAEAWPYDWQGPNNLYLEPGQQAPVGLWIAGNGSILMDTQATLTVEGRSGPARANLSRVLTMGLFSGVELAPSANQTLPVTAWPQTPATLNLTLTSRANHLQTLQITTLGPANWSWNLSQAEVTLGPWGSADLTLKASPMAEAYLPPGSLGRFELRAGEGAGPANATLELTTEVGAYHGLRLSGPATFQLLQAGRNNTFNLTVTNPGNEPAPLEGAAVGLPEGWQGRVLGLEAAGSLGPGQRRDLTLQINPGAQALAGAWSRITARIQDPWSVAALSFTLEVAPRYGLNLDLNQTAYEVDTGQNLTVAFTLANPGNLNQTYTLALQPQGGQTQLGLGFISDRQTLAPFTNRTLTAWIAIPPMARGDDQYQARLVVTGAASGEKKEVILLLQVKPVVAIETSLELSELQGGVSGSIWVNITNSGNLPVTLNLSFEPLPWGAELAPTGLFTLSPGQNRSQRYELAPPRSFEGLAGFNLTLSSPDLSEDLPLTKAALVRQAAPLDTTPGFPWVRTALASMLLAVIVALGLPLLPWRRSRSRATEAATGAASEAAPEAGPRSAGKPAAGSPAAGSTPETRAPSKMRLQPTTRSRPSRTVRPSRPGPPGAEPEPSSTEGPASPPPSPPSAPAPPPSPSQQTLPSPSPHGPEPEPEPLVRHRRFPCPECRRRILIPQRITEDLEVSCLWCRTRLTLRPRRTGDGEDQQEEEGGSEDGSEERSEAEGRGGSEDHNEGEKHRR